MTFKVVMEFKCEDPKLSASDLTRPLQPWVESWARAITNKWRPVRMQIQGPFHHARAYGWDVDDDKQRLPTLSLPGWFSRPAIKFRAVYYSFAAHTERSQRLPKDPPGSGLTCPWCSGPCSTSPES